MNIRKLTFMMVSVAAFLLSTLSFSQEMPFQSGEKLQYNISYKCGFQTDIIALTMSLEDSQKAELGDAYHAVCSIKTYKFFDAFYRMRETYESWFTKDKDIKPLEFFREAHNGKNYNSVADLKWGDDNSVKVNIRRDGKPAIDTVYREETILRDMINSIYFARLLDFKAMEDGSRVKVMMTPYRDILELSVRLVKKEVKKVGKAGSFNTLKLGMTIIPKKVQATDQSGFKVGTSDKGDYMGDEKIFLWVTDDENHMPVYFTSPATVGSITGMISEYEGLKYPLDGKIAD